MRSGVPQPARLLPGRAQATRLVQPARARGSGRARRLSNSIAAMNDSDDGRLHANPAAASGPTDQEREQFAIRDALEAAGIFGADAAELAAATKLEGSRVEL